MRNIMIQDTMKRAIVALGIVAVAAGAAGAQQAAAPQSGGGPKFQGWLGCWTPASAEESEFAPPAANAMLVCISPTDRAEAVTVTTLENGKTVSQQTLDATGREQPLAVQGCSGAQRARWSSDERRLFLTSAGVCEGLRNSTSAILSITPTGEWLDVRGVTVAGTENVRVARYRDAGLPGTVPAEIAAALRGRTMATGNARIASGGQVGTDAVLEASRSSEASVVSAWLLELRQPFALSAATLQQLAKAGMPGKVSDAMVAVSYPKAFQVARADLRDRSLDDDRLSGRRVRAFVDYSMDPWGWGASRYGYGSLGYGPYGYSPYGYNPYGYRGGYYGGYYSPPIIIVRGGNQPPAPQGRVVKGQGYTQTQGAPTSGSARPRQSSSPSPSASPSGSSSSSGSSGASSGSSGRTAKPRN